MTLQLIGVKNITGEAAVDQFGAALFEREATKPQSERIAHKLFEIMRRLLVLKTD